MPKPQSELPDGYEFWGTLHDGALIAMRRIRGGFEGLNTSGRMIEVDEKILIELPLHMRNTIRLAGPYEQPVPGTN